MSTQFSTGMDADGPIAEAVREFTVLEELYGMDNLMSVCTAYLTTRMEQMEDVQRRRVASLLIRKVNEAVLKA